MIEVKIFVSLPFCCFIYGLTTNHYLDLFILGFHGDVDYQQEDL